MAQDDAMVGVGRIWSRLYYRIGCVAVLADGTVPIAGVRRRSLMFYDGAAAAIGPNSHPLVRRCSAGKSRAG